MLQGSLRLEMPAAGGELPFGDSYRFLGAGLRISTDSRPLVRFLRDLYPRFLATASAGEVELRVRIKGSPPACPAHMECGTRRHLVVRTRRGYVLRSEDSGAEGSRERTVEALRFDRDGVHPVSPAEVGPAVAEDGPPADDEKLFGFVQLVLLRTLAGLLPGRQLLHGASAAWDGAGVVLAGTSGQGKTILSLALAGHGFSFLADDVACLDLENRRLEPFPRSLNLRRSSLPLLASVVGRDRLERSRLRGPIDIERLFPDRLGRACPLRYVFLLAGFARRPAVRPIPRRQALWRALKLSHSPVREPGRTLLRLAPLFQQARCHELTLGEPDATARSLRRLIAGLGHDPLPEG